jgi:hypothetical protein
MFLSACLTPSWCSYHPSSTTTALHAFHLSLQFMSHDGRPSLSTPRAAHPFYTTAFCNRLPSPSAVTALMPRSQLVAHPTFTHQKLKVWILVEAVTSPHHYVTRCESTTRFSIPRRLGLTVVLRGNPLHAVKHLLPTGVLRYFV